MLRAPGSHAPCVNEQRARFCFLGTRAHRAPALRIVRCARCSQRPASVRAHDWNIFVIEDDPGLNQALGRLLEAAGFRARIFESAEAALRDDAIEAADCFVLDIHLPGISGFALHGRLAARGVRAPIILITAHDDPIHRRTAREIGAAAYLTKPFASTTLIDAVEHAMEQSEKGTR